MQHLNAEMGPDLYKDIGIVKRRGLWHEEKKKIETKTGGTIASELLLEINYKLYWKWI